MGCHDLDEVRRKRQGYDALSFEAPRVSGRSGNLIAGVAIHGRKLRRDMSPRNPRQTKQVMKGFHDLLPFLIGPGRG